MKENFKYFTWNEKPELKTGILTIQRPEALNALNSELLAELLQILREIEQTKSLRSLIITGQGKAFIAGADISEMSGLNSDEGNTFAQQGQAVFRQLEKMPQISIAAINGFALGGGLELALACDIRIVSDKALMGQPEVNLGLIPGFGATQRLPRVVGMGWAKYLILTGEQIDSQKAMDIGLAIAAAEPDKLLDLAESIAKKVAFKGPRALWHSKQAVEASFANDLDQGLAIEADFFGQLFPKQNGDTENEMVEGTQAFLQKRKANFHDMA